MTDLTKLEIWIDGDYKATASELLADNDNHGDLVGIGGGFTTLSVIAPAAAVKPSVGPSQPQCSVLTLAREFQRTVRDCFFHRPTMDWEGADGEPTSAYWQWAKGQQAILAGIDQKNRDGGFDKTIDHLADATDANEYMIEAWDVAARCRLMAGSWVHANLTNDAWQMAKEWGYAMPDPSDLPRPCGDCGRAVAYNFAADDWEHVGSTECFLAGPGQDDAQYAPEAVSAQSEDGPDQWDAAGLAWDECHGCSEYVVEGEHHGEGAEWLCGDCYSTWKRCAECKRTMTDDECGDELPEERVCDTCAGIEADAPEEAANPYVGKRCTQCDVEMRTDNKRGMDWSWVCAACAPTLKEWAATMPVGTRVLVTGECFPHWLGKDEPGVVVLDDTDTPGGSVWIRLDRYFEGLSDWDNEVGVTPDDWSHGSAHRVVKVAPQEPTHDTDSCEDAGCPDHGIDAMPERWAEDAGTQ